MTTREQIIAAANRGGAFVNTDGEWCATRTPAEFAEFLEREYGFDVVECHATGNSTAIAVTACGMQIVWNGFCRRVGERA